MKTRRGFLAGLLGLAGGKQVVADQFDSGKPLVPFDEDRLVNMVPVYFDTKTNTMYIWHNEDGMWRELDTLLYPLSNYKFAIRGEVRRALRRNKND